VPVAEEPSADDQDFHAFVQARWVALVRYAYLLTGDVGHAEDVVQVALEGTWRRWRQLRTDRPEVYVRAAIAHRVVSRHRMLRRRVAESAMTATVPAAATDPTASTATREAVWRELSALPPRMRAVVVLRIWEDLSEQDTAAALGCSTGSVKSQLSRALARLRGRDVLRDAVGLGEAPADPPTNARLAASGNGATRRDT
jgi:RNA polymerase sigma-70 factor (sigma-E family)